MAVDIFAELERSHEARYKLDQELHFKAQCRSSKMLGRWAAERLGLPTKDAETYAKRMVGVALGSGGSAAVTSAIRQDLEKAGVPLPTADIDLAAEHCLAEAVASLMDEYPLPLGPDHIRIGN